MTRAPRITTALAAALLAGVVATAALGNNAPASSARRATAQKAQPTAADLRVTLDKLLGEHAALAMNATNAGVTGAASFPAIAKQLDRNSVALSKAIGSIYGKKAGNVFLNGKFMWRDHIRFFVDYTTAVAKKDTAAQNKAVANLKTYTVKFGDFLAGATGLPKLAVRNDLLGHILELKTQLDAFSGGRYAKSQSLYDHAYNHMFATGDLLAGAIAKQKNLK